MRSFSFELFSERGITSDVGTSKSPISFVIEFASDAAFTSIVQTLNSNTTSVQQSFSTAGIYYWRVRAVDGAGNIGTNNTGYKFTVN